MFDPSDLEAIVFDCDGVLINTEGLQWLGWVEVLKPLGLSLSKQEYFGHAGKAGYIIEGELLKKFGLKNEPLLEEKGKLLVKWFSEKEIEKMPFAEESINYFTENGFNLVLCSGSNRAEIDLKLKHSKLDRFFDKIVSNDDIEHSKPFPDMYLRAAEIAGSSPEKCLAIEDMQYGVESAKGAGMNCFAVPTEYSVKQDFSKADKVFNNLEEIINWFKAGEK